MATSLLNEAELLLVKQWDEAFLLAQSMDRVRQKYTEIFQRIAETVVHTQPSFDAFRIHVTQFWSQGAIGFGRKTWPEAGTSDMAGFWLDNLRLEVLSDEDAPQPVASLWIAPKVLKKMNFTLEHARAEMLRGVLDLFTIEEQQKFVKPDMVGNSILCFSAPTKREMLDMFMAGDGSQFVDAVVNCFEIMARVAEPFDRLMAPNAPASA